MFKLSPENWDFALHLTTLGGEWDNTGWMTTISNSSVTTSTPESTRSAAKQLQTLSPLLFKPMNLFIGGLLLLVTAVGGIFLGRTYFVPDQPTPNTLNIERLFTQILSAFKFLDEAAGQKARGELSPDDVIEEIKLLCSKKDFEFIALQSLKSENELITQKDISNQAKTSPSYIETAEELCSNINNAKKIDKQQISNDQWTYRYHFTLDQAVNNKAYGISFYSGKWRFVLRLPFRL